jgi:hypothetical protein
MLSRAQRNHPRAPSVSPCDSQQPWSLWEAASNQVPVWVSLATLCLWMSSFTSLQVLIATPKTPQSTWKGVEVVSTYYHQILLAFRFYGAKRFLSNLHTQYRVQAETAYFPQALVCIPLCWYFSMAFFLAHNSTRNENFI